jgi:hypothetical protein
MKLKRLTQGGCAYLCKHTLPTSHLFKLQVLAFVNALDIYSVLLSPGLLCSTCLCYI